MDDEASFREFVSAWLGRLSRIAYLLTGDHHAAEDLVQVTLVKVARHWRRVTKAGAPDAYVRRALYHEHVSSWRGRRMRELSTAGTPVLGPDDRTLFMVTRVTAAGRQHQFLVGFDLETAMVTERYPLPDEIPAAQRSTGNGGVEYGQPDARYVLGIHPDGPLLLHIAPSRSDPFTIGSVSIELIARDTGTLSTVTLVSRPITLVRYPG